MKGWLSYPLRTARHSFNLIRRGTALSYPCTSFAMASGLAADSWRSVRAKSGGRSVVESVKLYGMRPERRWPCGLEQWTTRSGLALRSGGQVWLY